MEQFPDTMVVRTSHGVEKREVDHMRCFTDWKQRRAHGTGLIAVPRLRKGEEIRWATDGSCHVIETPVGPRFVTGLRYDYDGQQILRIVEYSDGTTYENHVAQMPTREEFEKEKELYSVHI